MDNCKNCEGVGLVSTGANPRDLNSGQKVVCVACGGSGKAPNMPAQDTTQPSPSPKDPSPSDTGDASGEPSSAGPNVGDPCLTATDQPGTLGKDDQGNWVCNPN